MLEILKAKQLEYTEAIKAQTDTIKKLQDALTNANRNLIALSGALQSTEEIIAELEKTAKPLIEKDAENIDKK
jgi:hypothetical protein